MASNQPECGNSRREFLKKSTLISALALGPATALRADWTESIATAAEQQLVKLEINGKAYALNVEPRVTLLDLLREHVHLTGTKKGCDHGQCGACTVHVNGTRINSCMTLAVMQEGKKITTIEGLANGDKLHP